MGHVASLYHSGTSARLSEYDLRSYGETIGGVCRVLITYLIYNSILLHHRPTIDTETVSSCSIILDYGTTTIDADSLEKRCERDRSCVGQRVNSTIENA